MYKLLIVVMCVAAAAAGPAMTAGVFQSRGIVNPVARCGGVGTPIQLRVSNCEGRCQLVPGTRYDCEGDFIPSSASPSLSLKVDVVHLGVSWPILEVVLPGSSVQPGNIYTVQYQIVPNDILSGNAVYLRASIYHTDNRLEEICISAEVDIM